MLIELRKINKLEVAVVTSLDVAETFEKRHDNVLRDIRELECSCEFRRLNFEESTYVNAQNKNQPMCFMTRDGFTILAMGYNGEKAMRFKEGYIKQFNAMEQALRGKLVEREKGIAIRQALTKALQQTTENDRMHGHAYSTYTNVIYKSVFGTDARHLREEYRISKNDNLRDYFSEEDLRQVQNAEMLVSALIGYVWGYDEIRNFITDKTTNKLTA